MQDAPVGTRESDLEAAYTAYGAVHVLCNNAGVGAHEDVPIWELPLSDWRWVYKREDTVWYPSVRVLRQSAPGAWDELLNRVAAEVRRRAEAAGGMGEARG